MQFRPSDVNKADEKYDQSDSDGNGKNYCKCSPCSQTDTVSNCTLKILVPFSKTY